VGKIAIQTVRFLAKHGAKADVDYLEIGRLCEGLYLLQNAALYRRHRLHALALGRGSKRVVELFTIGLKTTPMLE